jgi:hypothetical protein
LYVNTGQTTCDHFLCITSLPPERASPAQLLALHRGHWAIENRLHYVRDFSFDEDRCRARTGHGPQGLACLRNAAISLLRLLGWRSIASALRHFASRPPAALRVVTG